MNKQQKIVDLTAKLKILEQKEKKLKNKLYPIIQTQIDTENKIATLLCPFNIGETITDEKNAFLIHKIVKEFDGYKMYGYKIKKDNTAGSVLRKLYQISKHNINKWKVIKPQTKGEKT